MLQKRQERDLSKKKDFLFSHHIFSATSEQKQKTMKILMKHLRKYSAVLKSPLKAHCRVADSETERAGCWDYISEDKELFHTLFDKKDALEADAGLSFDWRELPEPRQVALLLRRA